MSRLTRILIAAAVLLFALAAAQPVPGANERIPLLLPDLTIAWARGYPTGGECLPGTLLCYGRPPRTTSDYPRRDERTFQRTDAARASGLRPRSGPSVPRTTGKMLHGGDRRSLK